MRTRNADAERRAEEKDRHAQISTILSEFQFASPDAAAAARSLFAGQISRVKDGEALVGPDGTTPYDKYLRESIEGPQSFFLAPKNVSGAGAGNPGGRSGGKTINAEGHQARHEQRRSRCSRRPNCGTDALVNQTEPV
jgi:hypothetical protein